MTDSLDSRISNLMQFARSRNCGIGPGGFQTGNTCASGKAADAAAGAAAGAVKGAAVGLGVTWNPAGAAKGAAIGAAVGAVKGLYDNSRRPTRVMKTIERIGSSEEKVGLLVQRLGGSSMSSANVDGKSLTLKVKDKSGEKMFDVSMNSKKVVITPARKSGTLTAREINAVKKVAVEHAPREVAVIVKSRSPSYLSTLVRKGFRVTASAAGTLVASFVAPFAASSSVAVAEAVAKKVI